MLCLPNTSVRQNFVTSPDGTLHVGSALNAPEYVPPAATTGSVPKSVVSRKYFGLEIEPALPSLSFESNFVPVCVYEAACSLAAP